MAADERVEYIFKPFNAETLEATKTGWIASSDDSFPSDVEQTLEWAADHVATKDNQMAYGVFNGAEKVAIGISEVVISHPSKKSWVKLLRLRLHPVVEQGIFNNDPDAVTTAISAYVAAVLGVYHVKTVHNASTIKIYGRTQEQVRFLTLLATALKSQAAEFVASIEGRWLVLRWAVEGK